MCVKHFIQKHERNRIKREKKTNQIHALHANPSVFYQEMDSSIKQFQSFIKIEIVVRTNHSISQTLLGIFFLLFRDDCCDGLPLTHTQHSIIQCIFMLRTIQIINHKWLNLLHKLCNLLVIETILKIN